MKTRLLAGGLLAALVLTGCGDDGAVRGDTAAKVGDVRITTESLAELVQQVRDEPGADAARTDLPAFQRDVLQLLVNAAASDIVSRRAGLTVTQEQLDEVRSQIAEQSGVSLEDLAASVAKQGLTPALLERVLVLNAQQQALTERLIAETFVDPAQLQAAYGQARSSFQKASISQIVLPSAAAANALLAQARGLDDEAFIKLASEKTTQAEGKASGGVIEGLMLSSFTSAGQEAYGTAVFAAKAGDTIVVPSETGANLVRILELTTPTLAEVTPQLRRQLLGEQAQSVVVAELAEVDVRLNPRFGTWDAATTSVIGPDQKPGRKLSVSVKAPDPAVTDLGGS